MIRKFVDLFAVALLVAAAVVYLGAEARADVCTGVWSIGVGGVRINYDRPLALTAEDSDYLQVDQRVGYNSLDLPAGVHELNRLVDLHRALCPADHLVLLGHSGGAAVVHVWVSEHKSTGNLSAVLLADPKRAAGPGGPGFMALLPMDFLLYPEYSGADADFGAIPVLEVCHSDDHVCNSAANWLGYLSGAHTDYDFDARHYPVGAAGVVFR